MATLAKATHETPHDHKLGVMRIITGDETGLIKQVLIENKRIVVVWKPVYSVATVGSTESGQLYRENGMGRRNWLRGR